MSQWFWLVMIPGWQYCHVGIPQSWIMLVMGPHGATAKSWGGKKKNEFLKILLCLWPEHPMSASVRVRGKWGSFGLACPLMCLQAGLCEKGMDVPLCMKPRVSVGRGKWPSVSRACCLFLWMVQTLVTICEDPLRTNSECDKMSWEYWVGCQKSPVRCQN